MLHITAAHHLNRCLRNCGLPFSPVRKYNHPSTSVRTWRETSCVCDICWWLQWSYLWMLRDSTGISFERQESKDPLSSCSMSLRLVIWTDAPETRVFLASHKVTGPPASVGRVKIAFRKWSDTSSIVTPLCDCREPGCRDWETVEDCYFLKLLISATQGLYKSYSRAS